MALPASFAARSICLVRPRHRSAIGCNPSPRRMERVVAPAFAVGTLGPLRGPGRDLASERLNVGCEGGLSRDQLIPVLRQPIGIAIFGGEGSIRSTNLPSASSNVESGSAVACPSSMAWAR